MKKIFSIVTTVLFLSVLSFNFVLAEDTATDTVTDTSTEEDATTSADNTATTTDDELTTTSTDDTLTTTDDTTAAEDTSTTNETTTATDESTSFLDSIDTVWLWVILGVGGVVLIGSLIGIISLSKKEKSETPVVEEVKPVESAPQTATVVEEKKEEIPVQQTEQPIPQEAPVITETIPEETPKVEEIPSIKETLGDTSAYQQPESSEQIVSNIAPTVDVNKDLEDINMATQQEATEPAVSTIETPVVEPTPVQEQPQSNGLDMMNNMPLSQEAPVQTPETASMPNPQNPESVQTTQNPSDQGLNQPVDTTSL